MAILTEKHVNSCMNEIFKNMLEIFDLLTDQENLELFLSKLTEDQRDKLYGHALLQEYDLLL